MEELNYQIDIQINKYNLDEHWENQSELAVKYSELSVDANKEKEKTELNIEILEEDLKETLAQLVLEVKHNHKKYKFEKTPSDSTANAWAITQEIYKEKKIEIQEEKLKLIQARDTAFRLRNVARQFEERRFSLQNLTTLFLNGYYSSFSENKIEVVKKEKKSLKGNGHERIKSKINETMKKRIG